MSYIEAFEIARLGQSLVDAISRIPRPVITDNNPFLGLRDLRGYWPMNIHGVDGSAVDQSGGIGTLTNQDVQYDVVDGRNVAEFDGSNSILYEESPYLSKMTGLGAWTRQPKGITMGAWVLLTAEVTNAGFISKWNTFSVSEAEFVFFINGLTPSIRWSTDGSGTISLTTGVSMADPYIWQFIVARLRITSTSWPTTVTITLFTDLDQEVHTPTWDDPPFEADASLVIGYNPYASPTFPVLSAYVRDAFICDCALTDEEITSLYHATA